MHEYWTTGKNIVSENLFTCELLKLLILVPIVLIVNYSINNRY